jgi:hypothetical protein
MVSGELAAKAIVASRAELRGLATTYRRACDAEIGQELRDSVLIQRHVFGDRRRIARIIGGARREVAFTSLFVDVATGRRPYLDLRRRLIAHAPLLAARLLWASLRRDPVHERAPAPVFDA